MKNTHRILEIWFTLLTAGVLLSSCSELKKDLPAPSTDQGIHAEGWSDPQSPAFHGTALKNANYESQSCQKCHAKSYGGGTSGVSCTNAQCHASYPHKPGWLDAASTDFHGTFLRRIQYDMTECAECHGTDFTGGSSGKSCYTCHASYPHKADWTNASASGSHGKYLKNKNWQTAECAACHGSDYAGGTSGKSCFTCHPSYPHTVFAAFSGHPRYLVSKSYPLAQCKTCHGSNYDGGSVVNVTCMRSGCHVDNSGTKKTPEACNTCHGQFRAPANDALSAAPPKGVLGDSLESHASVGSHQKHLVSGTLGKSVKCAECHAVPVQTFLTGHLDTALPAEVAFKDTLARLKTGDGLNVPQPLYSSTTLKCSDTYCHGSWMLRRATSPYASDLFFADSVMRGENFMPTWTGGIPQAACGTCHQLPPKGHVPKTRSECALCHGDVVNASGNIVNPAKHINGKINVFGIERNF